MRREVARQAEFPAKGMAGNFFVARHLAIISCNSEKVPRHAIDPIGQPPNPAADGWRFAIALQSATRPNLSPTFITARNNARHALLGQYPILGTTIAATPRS